VAFLVVFFVFDKLAVVVTHVTGASAAPVVALGVAEVLHGQKIIAVGLAALVVVAAVAAAGVVVAAGGRPLAAAVVAGGAAVTAARCVAGGVTVLVVVGAPVQVALAARVAVAIAMFAAGNGLFAVTVAVLGGRHRAALWFYCIAHVAAARICHRGVTVVVVVPRLIMIIPALRLRARVFFASTIIPADF
jgi:hypothetical protein